MVYTCCSILFLGHGTWLKVPLEIRRIGDITTQEQIVYAMIYLFNEMMIQTGACFNEINAQNPSGRKRVCHIDSRGSIGKDGWTDELHAHPCHFINTGRVFSYCIHDHNHSHSSYDHVYIVSVILKRHFL